MGELVLVGKNNTKHILQDTGYSIYLSQGMGEWRVIVKIQQTLGFSKCAKYLDKLRNCQILKNS